MLTPSATFRQHETGLVAVRKDLGRHKALHKLAGALGRTGAHRVSVRDGAGDRRHWRVPPHRRVGAAQQESRSRSLHAQSASRFHPSPPRLRASHRPCHPTSWSTWPIKSEKFLPGDDQALASIVDHLQNIGTRACVRRSSVNLRAVGRALILWSGTRCCCCRRRIG
jgi:hypothetical protein